MEIQYKSVIFTISLTLKEQFSQNDVHYIVQFECNYEQIAPHFVTEKAAVDYDALDFTHTKTGI